MSEWQDLGTVPAHKVSLIGGEHCGREFTIHDEDQNGYPPALLRLPRQGNASDFWYVRIGRFGDGRWQYQAKEG